MQRTTWLSAFVLAASACLGVWALSTWSDRRIVLQAASANLAATARLLEQHADRALEAGDRAVQAAVAAAGDPATLDDPWRAARLHGRLRELVEGSPQLASAWVIDVTGISIAGNWTHPPRATALADRPYFQAHLRGERGLHLGELATGTPSARPRFTLSRPLLDAEGGFAGVVAAGVFVEYFGAIYAEAGLGPGARFALFRADGAPLAAWPLAPNDEPPTLMTEAAALPAPGQGELREGEGNLTALRHLARFPAVLVVSQPQRDALADWRRRTVRSGAVTAAVISVLALLTLFGLRGARYQRALTIALRSERVALERRVAVRTAELAESEARFREMADNAPVMVWVADAHGHCVFVSRSWCAFTGQRIGEGLRLGWQQAIHPEDRPAVDRQFRRAMLRQEPFRMEYRVRHADGAWRWVLGAATPRRDSAGEFLGFIGSMMDITDRREAEQRQTLMSRELDHRAKNALAVVQAALRLTPKTDPTTYAAAVEGRVAALARAHSALAEGRWAGAALRTLAEGELAVFLPVGTRAAPPRAVLEGPDLRLAPPAVQALSMALHELATNATKYGALSVPDGQVTVRWWRDEAAGMLRIDWSERGGPPLRGQPGRRGFGSRVIEATVVSQLGGEVERGWEEAGLVCRMAVPLARVLAEAAAAEPARPAELELLE